MLIVVRLLIAICGVAAVIADEQYFALVRASNGAALCATDPATVVTSARSAILCGALCMDADSCCNNYNYFADTRQCQLFYNSAPTNYAVIKGCVSATVGTTTLAIRIPKPVRTVKFQYLDKVFFI